MKSKTKTQQTSQNTYGFQTPPTTHEQANFDNWAQTAYDTPDPNIPFVFNNMRETAKNRYNNPFGANYSPEAHDAAMYNQMNSIDQMQGEANREDTYNRKNAKGQALQTSAAMHAPILTQTGGTMTGTQTTNPGFGGLLMSGISAGASLGSAAMM